MYIYHALINALSAHMIHIKSLSLSLSLSQWSLYLIVPNKEKR